MDSDEVRRALLAILNLSDREARWLGWRSGWLLPTIDEVQQSYGHRRTNLRFNATPQDLTHADGLADRLVALRSAHGKDALRILFAWATGCQPWQMAQRLNCTPRTIRNRLKVYLHALGVDVQVERGPGHATHTAPAKGTHADAAIPAPVYSRARLWVNGAPDDRSARAAMLEPPAVRGRAR